MAPIRSLALAALALLASASQGLVAAPGPEMALSRAGYPFAVQGWTTPVFLDATNLGPGLALDAWLEERAPLAAPPLAHAWGLALPPPREVALDAERGEVVLRWALGTMRPGDTFHAQYAWVALAPGLWNFTTTLTYQDLAGGSHAQVLRWPLKVVAALPPLPPEP